MRRRLAAIAATFTLLALLLPAGAAAHGPGTTAQTERARLAQMRYDNGSAAYLEVLDAQRDLLDVEQQVVQTRRALLASQIAMYSALGGGLDPAEPLTNTHTSSNSDPSSSQL